MIVLEVGEKLYDMLNDDSFDFVYDWLKKNYFCKLLKFVILFYLDVMKYVYEVKLWVNV